MNTVSIDFKPFIEWDNNPFILFDNLGKILYLNNAAEILLGYVTRKEIFELALSHAPQSYGFQTAPVTLRYDIFNFFSVTVGYENEEQLGIRLYNAPRIRNQSPVENDKLVETDLNILLEANIALFRTRNNNKLELLTDPDLPTLKIDQNTFSKLLRKVFEAFRASDSIRIELKMSVGEHVLIEGKKTPLALLSISANGRYVDTDKQIIEFSESCHVRYYLHEKSIKLEIPLIS